MRRAERKTTPEPSPEIVKLKMQVQDALTSLRAVRSTNRRFQLVIKQKKLQYQHLKTEFRRLEALQSNLSQDCVKTQQNVVILHLNDYIDRATFPVLNPFKDLHLLRFCLTPDFAFSPLPQIDNETEIKDLLGNPEVELPSIDVADTVHALQSKYNELINLKNLELVCKDSALQIINTFNHSVQLKTAEIEYFYEHTIVPLLKERATLLKDYEERLAAYELHRYHSGTKSLELHSFELNSAQPSPTTPPQTSKLLEDTVNGIKL